MKRQTKKFISIILLSLILLSPWLSLSSFAEDKPEPEQDIVIGDPDAGSIPSNLDVPYIVSGDILEKGVHAERAYDREEGLNDIAYLNQDGTYTSYFFSMPVKYLDENGTVQDKDNSLSPVTDDYHGEEYAFVNAHNDIKTYFPHSLGEEDGILLTYGNREITLTPVTREKALPAEEKALDCSGRELSYLYYPGLFGQNTSVRYAADFNGFKEDIILYTVPESNRFTYLLNTDGLYAESDGRSVALINEHGEKEAYLSDIFVYDSFEGEDTGDAEHLSFNGSYEVKPIEDGFLYEITMTVDSDFLQSPDTVYPVYVDPSVTFNNTAYFDDTFISSASNTNFGSYGSFSVGYSSSYGITRGLIRFPAITTFTYFTDSDYAVDSMKLYLCNIGPYHSNVTPYQFTGTIWMEVTNLTGAYLNSYSTTPQMASVYTANPYSYTEFDITALAQSWKQYVASPSSIYADPNKGLMLKNSNESSTSFCQTFASKQQSMTTIRPYVVYSYSVSSPPPGTISIFVKDLSGAGISGAKVYIYPDAYTTPMPIHAPFTTDANGFVNITPNFDSHPFTQFGINVIASADYVQYSSPALLTVSNTPIYITLKTETQCGYPTFFNPFGALSFTPPSIDGCQNFGWRYLTDTNTYVTYEDYHLGVDISNASNGQNLAGEVVYSIASGYIKTCGTDSSQGNFFTMCDLSRTYYIRCMHLNVLSYSNTNEGDLMTPFGIIGTVGSTGAAFGAHLHIQIAENTIEDPETFNINTCIDPFAFFSRDILSEYHYSNT